ncbi:MAG: hypothetical protein WAM39_32770 [Bryobacteraceae bacterium]
MACPFFEPVTLAPMANSRNARLPLIREYAGHCARQDGGIQVSDRSCNQGYARGVCDYFPSSEKNRANRYSLLNRGESELRLLFVIEEDYSPAAIRTLHFSIHQDCLLESDLDPCVSAQALAFCRSYLKAYGKASC